MQGSGYGCNDTVSHDMTQIVIQGPRYNTILLYRNITTSCWNIDTHIVRTNIAFKPMHRWIVAHLIPVDFFSCYSFPSERLLCCNSVSDFHNFPWPITIFPKTLSMSFFSLSPNLVPLEPRFQASLSITLTPPPWPNTRNQSSRTLVP